MYLDGVTLLAVLAEVGRELGLGQHVHWQDVQTGFARIGRQQRAEGRVPDRIKRRLLRRADVDLAPKSPRDRCTPRWPRGQKVKSPSWPNVPQMSTDVQATALTETSSPILPPSPGLQ
jgi:hypothetical protein